MDNLLADKKEETPSQYKPFDYEEGRDPIGLKSLNGLGKHIKVKRNSEWSQENNIEIHAISLDPNLKNLCTGHNVMTGDVYDFGPGLLDYLKSLNDVSSSIQSKIDLLKNIGEKRSEVDETGDVVMEALGLPPERTSKIAYLKAESNHIKSRAENHVNRVQYCASEFLSHFDLVIMPRLGVKNMLEKGKLASQFKRILSQISHMKFFDRLKFKLGKRGHQLLEVDEAYTTQMCSCCGRRSPCSIL